MVKHSLIFAASASLITTVVALDAQLVGTWSTKSAQVLTGPVCNFLEADEDRNSECRDKGYSKLTFYFAGLL